MEAMRSSSELAETSGVLFHELKELGINAIRTGVGIFDDANEAMEIWGATVTDSQEDVNILQYVSIHLNPVFENISPARKKKKPFALTVLSGIEVKQYYQTMSAFLTMPLHQLHQEKEFFYSFFFSQGALNVTAGQKLTEEESNIIIRFAQVFELIYLRFLELLKAEAQILEAIRQTAFNRVRAEIASMRTLDDLNRITPLIWRELVTLGGFPFHVVRNFLLSLKQNRLFILICQHLKVLLLRCLSLPIQALLLFNKLLKTGVSKKCILNNGISSSSGIGWNRCLNKGRLRIFNNTRQENQQ